MSKSGVDTATKGAESPITSLSLVDEFLRNSKSAPLLSLPKDPEYVYPISTFPPLSCFDISINYPALIVPARKISDLRKSLRHILLQRPKIKAVYGLENNDLVPPGQDRERFRKLVLVDRPDIFQDSELQKLLQDYPDDYGRATHQVTASYEDWTVEQVLRRILPVQEVPSAFEIVGHLAHMNLRDEVLPFKYLVGKAVLDKNAPRIKTVVNKVGTIATKYRTFGMEVIAGNKEEGWSRVVVKEEGYQYELDFTQVYWNSRLGGEHRRLVELIRKEAEASSSPIIVADLMAGIGPFAVPLTSKDTGNVHVHANDLNPSSYKYLVLNSERNKCKNLHCYNMDGRAFCHMLQDKGIDFHHILMNLPATAPEFLDAFRGFNGKTLPRIHAHCFSKKALEEAERETIARCAIALGVPLDVQTCRLVVHLVRNVAPNKNMYCISFNLPESVRALPRVGVDHSAPTPTDEPEAKRAKLN